MTLLLTYKIAYFKSYIIIRAKGMEINKLKSKLKIEDLFTYLLLSKYLFSILNTRYGPLF